MIVTTTSRYLYVFPVKYDLVDFNLSNYTLEYSRRTIRFTKKEISLVISYINLESIVYI